VRRLEGAEEGGLLRAVRSRLDLLLIFLAATFVDVVILQSIDVLVVIIRGRRRRIWRRRRRDAMVDLGVGGGWAAKHGGGEVCGALVLGFVLYAVL
jgi:hypothetical protein